MIIFQKELYKVYADRKFLLVVLLFFGINAALLYTDTNNPIVRPQSYKETFTQIESMPASKRADYIKNRYHAVCQNENDTNTASNSIPEESYFLFSELYAQLEQIENYPEYLKDIQNRADNAGIISIFSHKDSFSVRNAKKTSEAFRPLENNTLEFTNTTAFAEAVDFLASDFFLIALLFYITIILVIQEKEKGLFALLKPLSYGRSHLICTKIGVLLFSAVFFLYCSGEVILLSPFLNSAR